MNQGKKIPNIHNLAELVSLCAETDKTFSILEPELKELNTYAVRTRYPGENAAKGDALEAIKKSKNASNFIRKKFGLK
jgi:HEPN domain-containing protein